jgi:hypothetical protein
MKSSAILMSALLATGAALVSTPATVRADDTRTVTVIGDVVRYEPGRTIVIRSSSGREVTYTLAPTIDVPSDLAVGRHVTLFTGAGSDGSTVVTRVTTSVTPEGDLKRTVERTHTNPAGETTRTVTTTIDGTVRTYEPGRSLTITRPDGTEVTYMINERSVLPTDLAVGRTVVIHPMTTVASKEPVIETVTYTTTKTKNGKTQSKTKTKTKRVKY